MLPASPGKRDVSFDEEPCRTALHMAEFLGGVPRYPKLHPFGLGQSSAASEPPPPPPTPFIGAPLPPTPPTPTQPMRPLFPFLVEHVEMTPLHRLDVIITNDFLAATLAFFRPKPLGFCHANHKGLLLLLKFRSDHFPTLAQTQQLMKRFFGCHHPMLTNSNLSIHRKRRGTL
jgi:hypothetical protein